MKKLIRTSTRLVLSRGNLARYNRGWMTIMGQAVFSTSRVGENGVQSKQNSLSESSNSLQAGSNPNPHVSSYPLRILKMQLDEVTKALASEGVSADQFVLDCIEVLEANLPGSGTPHELPSPSTTSYLFQLGKILTTTKMPISFAITSRLLDAIADNFAEFMSMHLIKNTFHRCLTNLDSLNDRFGLFRQFKEKFRKEATRGVIFDIFDPEACRVVEVFQKESLNRVDSGFKTEKDIIDYILNVLISDDLIFVLQSTSYNPLIMKLIADLDFRQFSQKQLVQLCFILKPIQKFTKKQLIDRQENIDFILSKIASQVPSSQLSDVDKITINRMKAGIIKPDNLSPIFVFFIQAVICEELSKADFAISVSFTCVFNNINVRNLSRDELTLLKNKVLASQLNKNIDLSPMIIFMHLACLHAQFDPKFEVRLKILNHFKDKFEQIESLNLFGLITIFTSLKDLYKIATDPTISKPWLSPEDSALVIRVVEIAKQHVTNCQSAFHVRGQEQIIHIIYNQMNLISDHEFASGMEEKFCNALVEGIKELDTSSLERIIKILTKNPAITKERARRLQQALKLINSACQSRGLSTHLQRIYVEDMRSLYKHCKKEESKEALELIEEIGRFVETIKKARAQNRL